MLTEQKSHKVYWHLICLFYFLSLIIVQSQYNTLAICWQLGPDHAANRIFFFVIAPPSHIWYSRSHYIPNRNRISKAKLNEHMIKRTKESSFLKLCVSAKMQMQQECGYSRNTKCLNRTWYLHGHWTVREVEMKHFNNLPWHQWPLSQ